MGVLARSDATVGAALAALEHAGVETHGERADAADEDSLRAGLDALTGRLGIPEALVYNAALTQGDSIGRAPASSGSRPPRRKPRWGRAPKGSRSSTRR